MQDAPASAANVVSSTQAVGDKIFVLDTNVLLYDPGAIFRFEQNEVVVPIYVIEEIDNFKKDLSETGRNARQVTRYLDELREDGDLAKGVVVNGGGCVRVAITRKDIDPEYQLTQNADNRILATALSCQESAQGRVTTFVTRDVNLRIRGHALGVRVENYDSERTPLSDLYTGVAELKTTKEAIDTFYETGHFALDDPYYYPNQFALLQDETNPSHTALGRINPAQQAVRPILDVAKRGIWGIRPRNKEQAFAVDALMDDNIKFVTLVGKAGTGKTLLAIAAGLQKVTEEDVYQRLLISRPVFPLGRDIGYLPGTVEEKLSPWMQPIFDNIEFLMGLSRSERRQGRSYTELLDLGILEIEPLTYIRGRSIPNQYLIVDEAQNLTPHEVKTIVSRAGENTKIVLTGDPFQIDNPYVDATNNGLIYTVNRFRAEPIAAHVNLIRGERSELAELASNLL